MVTVPFCPIPIQLMYCHVHVRQNNLNINDKNLSPGGTPMLRHHAAQTG